MQRRRRTLPVRFHASNCLVWLPTRERGTALGPQQLNSYPISQGWSVQAILALRVHGRGRRWAPFLPSLEI